MKVLSVRTMKPGLLPGVNSAPPPPRAKYVSRSVALEWPGHQLDDKQDEWVHERGGDGRERQTEIKGTSKNTENNNNF